MPPLAGPSAIVRLWDSTFEPGLCYYLLDVLFGAQVSQQGGFLAALRRGEEMGAEVLQLFAQSNRQWRMPDRSSQDYDTYRSAQQASQVVRATVCHAPYLVNVISPDPTTRARSAASLVANLRAASALGAFGLVLHPGSHRGVEPATATERIARCLLEALEEAADSSGTCGILLENTAGAGGTVGRSFGELAAMIEATGGDSRIGVCLDTQHLWASGVSYATPGEADQVIRQLASEVGLERLACIHLNDSKVPLGANRDRHENLGRGLIGDAALQALLGANELQRLPVVLEVPGEGHGPRAVDLAKARELQRRGLAQRA